MVVPVTNDPIVVAAVVVALLDIPRMVNEKSSEWLLYTVFLVSATLLFCFETIPAYNDSYRDGYHLFIDYILTENTGYYLYPGFCQLNT